ncbi:MAG: hypothetical protein CVU89_03670 [Firmicutes bacterium HGW-Firmicutes-14]|nr:MAG: hypothetical protein CVU89_03670 [Firmicutes bacterium HGW-Firmicutes-14]
MQSLLETVKSFGLTEFYFSLTVEDKTDLAGYSRHLPCAPLKSNNCSPGCDACFMVVNGAQFLWVTAANAIPDKKLKFAERLLIHALDIATDPEDVAWIHANLAQLYYDDHKYDPEAGRKSILHCRELIKLGYMKPWAKNMIDELMVFQVQ